MGEIPTRPGKPYKVTHEDARRAYTILATGANGFIEALQDFADRRMNASPWRPASEPPVVPEGKRSIEVFIAMEFDDDDEPMWEVGTYTDEGKWFSDPPDAWMYIPQYNKPIPPHGEGGAE